MIMNLRSACGNRERTFVNQIPVGLKFEASGESYSLTAAFPACLLSQLLANTLLRGSIEESVTGCLGTGPNTRTPGKKYWTPDEMLLGLSP